MKQMIDVLALVNESEQQAAAQARARQERLEAERAALQAAVDEVIALITNDVTAGEFEVEMNRYSDSVVAGWREVRVEELLPFYVVARIGRGDRDEPPVQVVFASHAPNDTSHKPHGRTLEAAADTVGVAALLKRQRDGWLQRQADREREAARALAEKMKQLRNDLAAHWCYPRLHTEDEARAALERLKAYYGPEQDADLDDLFTEWQAGHDRLAQENAERAVLEQQRKTEREQYRQSLADYQAAFAAYWAEVQRIGAANTARVEELQARWDQPYQIYELTYALVASADDEGGERYLETKTVTCLHPAQGDYQQVLSYGQVKLTQFQHVVSWQPPVKVKPTDSNSHAPGIDIGKLTGIYEQEIRYHPLTDRAKVAGDIAETMTPLPVEPTPPETIKYDDLKTAKGRVMRNDPEYVYHRPDYW